MRPIAVQVQTADASPALARTVVQALRLALDRLAVPLDLEIALVLGDDALLQRLNRAYRGIDAVTDVLSFGSDRVHTPPGEAPYLGDIVISIARAAANARDTGRSIESETSLLAVHGLLHLLGHDHDTESSAQAMEQLEVRLGVRDDQPRA